MSSLHGFTQELRYAARALRRAPGFTVAVVLTLALGIGATTAMFAVLYGVLFRPLPYADAERLLIIQMERTVDGTHAPVRAHFPFEGLEALQRRTDAFESVAFYASSTSVLSHRGVQQQVRAAAVSDAFFRTMQGRLREGRSWSSGEEAVGAAVLSERLRTRLVGTGNALGLAVTVDARTYEVVGVADDSFRVPDPETDIWTPASAARPCCEFAGVARLQAGQTGASAAAAVDGVIEALASGEPRIYRGARAAVLPLRDALVGTSRSTLWLMMSAVGLLLAVACANAAVLLTARAAAQWRDLAVRLALGAPARRLFLQSLAYGVAIAACAVVTGWALALVVVRFLRTADPGVRLPTGAAALRLDTPVLLFTILAAVVVVIGISLIPTLASLRGRSLVPSASGLAERLSGGRTQNTLVVLQLALSVVLLVTSLSLAAGLARLMTTDVGIRPEHVAVAAINLAHERTLSSRQQMTVVEGLTERIARLPEVQVAAVGASLPPNISNLVVTLKRAGDVVDYKAAAVPATPGYFDALGIRLLEGRLFAEDDRAGREEVMIMSADTARRFFGTAGALGRTLRLPVLRDGAPSSTDVRLVGIVANVKYSGVQAAPDDVIFRPWAQQPWGTGFVVVRASKDDAALLRYIRQEIAALDPAIAIGPLSTLQEIIASEAAQPRLRRAVVSAFALFALAIAACGLHGVTAYAVAQRTREFGIRLALGATPAQVMTLVMRGGSTLALGGVTLGLLTAHAAVRMLAATYPEVESADWMAYVLTAVLLVCVAGLATLVPAMRAASSDPLHVLRSE